jgi:SAM-dependent methyltransferase
MSLCDDYRQQFAFRSWSMAFDALPPLAGTTVLDLGCAIGDQAAELSARGATVFGFDAHPELLAAAQARNIPSATFTLCDLRGELPVPCQADGLWCSFAAAYFPDDLAERLTAWKRHLRDGAWVAFTEIDDLFAHAPLSPASQALLESYVEDARSAGRYDFRMGRRLAEELRRAGFEVSRVLLLPDAEFSQQGPVLPEVLSSWERRLDRMTLLQGHLGDEFQRFKDEFLACLAHPEHRSLSSVYFGLGRTPAEP